MKIVAIVPARYSSSRFPGKPLAQIIDKPMIQWVYERLSGIEILDQIIVATDNELILDTVTNFGGEAMMTSKNHTCGTDRLAECAEKLMLDDSDIILNIQGDEPLIQKGMILDLVSIFDSKDVVMGTLKKRIERAGEISNPNVVKVITDRYDNAICFSRYPLPYERNGSAVHYKHIGVYGYRKDFLLRFSRLEKTPLELAESLEQLRALENGFHIRVKETVFQTVGVDTPEQIEEVENLLRQGKGWEISE